MVEYQIGLDTTVVGAISLALYLLLFFVSFYHFVNLKIKQRTLGRVKSNQRQQLAERLVIGREYGRFEKQSDDSKILFFGVLAFSALADTPLYVACLVEDLPHNNCDWASDSFTATWILHFFALCGYAIALGIPLFMWSEVMNGRDGKILGSKYAANWTKKFLVVSVILYIVIELFTIALVLIYFTPGESDRFEALNLLTDISGIAEAVSIFLISVGWLWCGVCLQLYIRQLQFHREAESRIMWTVNLIMFAITFSFLFRAVLVASLSPDIGEEELSFGKYCLWVIGTRWLPYVFSSFLLIYVMQRSEAARAVSEEGLTRDTLDSGHASPRHSGFGPPQGSSEHSLSIVDSDLLYRSFGSKDSNCSGMSFMSV